MPKGWEPIGLADKGLNYQKLRNETEKMLFEPMFSYFQLISPLKRCGWFQTASYGGGPFFVFMLAYTYNTLVRADCIHV